MLCKTAILKNVYICRTPAPMAASVNKIPMINTYLFLLLKLLHEIAKFCQINWRIERTKTCGLIFFCKDKILKRQVASWEFCNYRSS